LEAARYVDHLIEICNGGNVVLVDELRESVKNFLSLSTAFKNDLAEVVSSTSVTAHLSTFIPLRDFVVVRVARSVITAARTRIPVQSTLNSLANEIHDQALCGWDGHVEKKIVPHASGVVTHKHFRELTAKRLLALDYATLDNTPDLRFGGLLFFAFVTVALIIHGLITHYISLNMRQKKKPFLGGFNLLLLGRLGVCLVGDLRGGGLQSLAGLELVDELLRTELRYDCNGGGCGNASNKDKILGLNFALHVEVELYEAVHH